ncbi:hypothetical protein HON36_04275 [Candidatus Parcubacteria bacterium]|jgi:hypothetical protein|nr:hypothetical protein [Candidatus Parcubacteria bacterium]MBT7228502.1 hypothetical protein [Candidatus Parcubacteria bacterium]
MPDTKPKNCQQLFDRVVIARVTIKKLETALASAKREDRDGLFKLKDAILVEIGEIKKDIFVIKTENSWAQFFVEVGEAQDEVEARELIGSRVMIYRDEMETQLHAPRHFNDKKFTTLPDNLIIGGNLQLKNCDVVRLPKNLQIKEDLRLTGTKLDELPSGMTVNELFIRRTGLTDLPDDLRAVIIHVDADLLDRAKELKEKGQITVIN